MHSMASRIRFEYRICSVLVGLICLPDALDLKCILPLKKSKNVRPTRQLVQADRNWVVVVRQSNNSARLATHEHQAGRREEKETDPRRRSELARGLWTSRVIDYHAARTNEFNAVAPIVYNRVISNVAGAGGENPGVEVREHRVVNNSAVCGGDSLNAIE